MEILVDGSSWNDWCHSWKIDRYVEGSSNWRSDLIEECTVEKSEELEIYREWQNER